MKDVKPESAKLIYRQIFLSQIRDLAERMSKDKEVAMARQQEVFEAKLHQVMQEKPQTDRELEQHSASTSPVLQMLPHSKPTDQQTGRPGWQDSGCRVSHVEQMSVTNKTGGTVRTE